MKYEFTEFGQRGQTAPLSIRSVLDGEVLDEILTTEDYTFTTVSVDGRGKTSYRVESVNVPGRHGSHLGEVRLDSRTIIIHATVKGNTPEDYREMMRRLNSLMFSKKVHELEFTDDDGHTFYGTCVSVNDESELSLRQHVKIEFTCTDPFKYTELKEVTRQPSELLDIDTDIPVVPEEIDITFNSNADAKNWTLINTETGHTIVFNQIRNVNGNRIIIRPKQNYIGYHPQSEQTNHIDGLNVRYSTFDEFKINSADRLGIDKDVVNIVVRYRGTKL